MEHLNPSSTASPLPQLEGPMALEELMPMDAESSSATPTSSSSSSSAVLPPINGEEGIPSTTTQAVGGAATRSPPENYLLSSTSSPSPQQFTGQGHQQENGGGRSPPQGAESSTSSPPCTEEPVAGTSSPLGPGEDSEDDLDDMPQSSSGGALADLLTAVDNYEPTIPDGVTNYLLTQAGFQSEDPRLAKLLSLATQKFISDVVNESFTICKLKGQVTNLNQQAKAKLKEKKYSLTLEDLGPVLSDNGITVKKPPYYT